MDSTGFEPVFSRGLLPLDPVATSGPVLHFRFKIQALCYLVWVGLVNRTHFVGAVRPHTPICDAHRRPRRAPRRRFKNYSHWP